MKLHIFKEALLAFGPLLWAKVLQGNLFKPDDKIIVNLSPKRP